MKLLRRVPAVFWLLVVAEARLSLVSKTIEHKADKAVALAPPIPTSTLVTDFQKDGVNSSWAEGHPKAWGAEAVKIKGPVVADVSSDEKFIALAAGRNVTIRDLSSQNLVSSVLTEFEGNPRSITIVQDRSGGFDVFVASTNYTTHDTITRISFSPDGLPVGGQTQYAGAFSSFDDAHGPFSPDGRRFLVLDNRRSVVVIYDIDNPASNVTLVGHLDWVMSAAFSPDGSLVSTTAWDGYGKVWNASTGEVLHTFGPSGGQNWKTAFSPDGKYVLFTSARKPATVSILSTADWSAKPIVIQDFGQWIRTASWSSDSKLLAAGTYGLIQVFSIDEQKVIQRWEMEDHWNWEPSDLFWIEESGLKLAYRTTAGLELYDFETNLKYRWGPDAYAQYDGAGSGDGTYLIRSKGWIGGVDADQTVRFYPFSV